MTSSGGGPGPNGYVIEADPQLHLTCGGDIDGVAHGIDLDGTFELPCHEGVWTLRVTDLRPGVGEIELGQAKVVVTAPGPVEVVIELKEP